MNKLCFHPPLKCRISFLCDIPAASIPNFSKKFAMRIYVTFYVSKVLTLETLHLYLSYAAARPVPLHVLSWSWPAGLNSWLDGHALSLWTCLATTGLLADPSYHHRAYLLFLLTCFRTACLTADLPALWWYELLCSPFLMEQLLLLLLDTHGIVIYASLIILPLVSLWSLRHVE